MPAHLMSSHLFSPLVKPSKLFSTLLTSARLISALSTLLNSLSNRLSSSLAQKLQKPDLGAKPKKIRFCSGCKRFFWKQNDRNPLWCQREGCTPENLEKKYVKGPNLGEAQVPEIKMGDGFFKDFLLFLNWFLFFSLGQFSLLFAAFWSKNLWFACYLLHFGAKISVAICSILDLKSAISNAICSISELKPQIWVAKIVNLHNGLVQGLFGVGLVFI